MFQSLFQEIEFIYPHMQGTATKYHLVNIINLRVLLTSEQRKGLGRGKVRPVKEENMKKSTGEKLILAVLAAQAPSKPYLL